MTIALTHISLLVEDVSKALHFYHDTLSFEITDNFPDYAALKVNENLKLSFFSRKAMEEALPSIRASKVNGHRSVIEFHVDQLDDLYKTLSAKGLQFISEPTDHPDWGIRTAYFEDLDGNLIELFEELK